MDVPTNQTHTSYVLGPGPGVGGDCSCPPVVIQQGRQTWSPCQAGHSPGVRKQQGGPCLYLGEPRRESPMHFYSTHTSASRAFISKAPLP